MRDLADRITWVVVADGAKALVFVNNHTPEYPDLNVLTKNEMENPPTREQGASPPGRFQDQGADRMQRSAVAETDWHEFEKERFAKEFAGALNKAAMKNAFDHLVVFAPPPALGRLRKEFHKETRDRLLFTVCHDLTNHPVDVIEKHLANAYKDHNKRPPLI